MNLLLIAGCCLHGTVFAACVDLHPVKTVVSVGGGQRASVNETLTATFRGHITTTVGLTSHGRNVVKICPGTTVEYAINSTIGEDFRTIPDCGDRYRLGSMAVGETISCNNKNLGGGDTDTFTVKEGR